MTPTPGIGSHPVWPKPAVYRRAFGHGGPVDNFFVLKGGSAGFISELGASHDAVVGQFE
jgi:hypothetical protein